MTFYFSWMKLLWVQISFWWILTKCFCNPSLNRNVSLHKLQMNSFFFQWMVLICFERCTFWVNRSAQKSHWNGFGFLWKHFMWRLRLVLWANDFLQRLHLYSETPSCTAEICFFNQSFLKNFWHNSHLTTFSRLCTLLTWFFRLLSSENGILQSSQLCFLIFSWTLFTCCFIRDNRVNLLSHTSHLNVIFYELV